MLTSEQRVFRDGLAAQRTRAAELRDQADSQRERAERQRLRCNDLQLRFAVKFGIQSSDRIIHAVDDHPDTLPLAQAVVALGASAGGFGPLSLVLADLPTSLGAAVIVAQHMGSSTLLPTLLRRYCHLPVAFAVQGEQLREGRVYIPPAGFHITIEASKTIVLSPRASLLPCPSVDRLFGSLAVSYGKHAIGVVLSGCQDDGAVGVSQLIDNGGCVIVQDPSTCAMSGMPTAALNTGRVASVLAPSGIAAAIVLTLAR